ncbi:P-loop containing nucleoside triphosphate hydrolase protein [Xylariomycetidae sp. FL0641]|nr:P-loop containing nucleoside triphosphate hydrolase protein [Xylariomycetidae sp. FL0641]
MSLAAFKQPRTMEAKRLVISRRTTRRPDWSRAPFPPGLTLTGRLFRFLRDVSGGKRSITKPDDARLLFEAVQAHEFPALCVETLATTAEGLTAIRTSVRLDVSVAFIEDHTLGFISVLSKPELKALAGGRILREILDSLVTPRTFWDAWLKAVLDGQTGERGTQLLAWTLHEIITSSSDPDSSFIADGKTLLEKGKLQKAESHEARTLAHKIEKAIRLKTGDRQSSSSDSEYSPGGRHDNDFEDFRQIATYPTPDELLSTEKPFYRPAGEVFGLDAAERPMVHLDNQYRLLREDMLGELREDLQVALGKKKAHRSPIVLSSLGLVEVDRIGAPRGNSCLVSVRCRTGLERLRKLSPEKKKKFLEKNPNFLKHQAFGAFFQAEKLCGFAFVDRNEQRLAEEPPVVCLQFVDSRALGKALLAFSGSENLRFVLINTPVFAYTPVLNELKCMESLPLHEVLLHGKPTHEESNPRDSPWGMRKLMEWLLNWLNSGVMHEKIGGSLRATLPKMDKSQLDSLAYALKSVVSLIQGPPGTGKSFLGSQAAKCIHDHSEQRVLVISYTNHALDQFLEDLLDVGIPKEAMVRLGSKYTARTAPLLMPRQPRHDIGFRHDASSWATMNHLKSEQSSLTEKIQSAFQDYVGLGPNFDTIMEHLEFSENDSDFYQAFLVPKPEGQWKHVGKKGKTVDKSYLFDRWCRGENRGPFHARSPKQWKHAWGLPLAARHQLLDKWMTEIARGQVEAVEGLSETLDKKRERLNELEDQAKIQYLKSKRIIGCTTTAAAMQQKVIRAAAPDVVLVEEAGEIQESHVLTALSPTVKQLILIGDHKQLRPKVNNYSLTVEKGNGYDLNMSLFERLILQGHKHTTLRKQHRMVPEISLFPRALTYPDLEDAPKTKGRPPIKGLRDRVVFINHEHSESQRSSIMDKLDADTKNSKENDHEAGMILSIVKYLSQQGYGTAKMVVLTPYLGQLRLLKQMLEAESQTDPVLNDLDAIALAQAGVTTKASAKVGKTPLRISTIDNYQGEESDIVIGSLTRSNPQGDIGFMAAPERLNVLITRARDCLILIGNMDTFMKKKRDAWGAFFQLLKDHGHLYDGLPVKCQRHDDRVAVLETPSDFGKLCPDGGCAQLCNAPLKCGLHQCRRQCHPGTVQHSLIDRQHQWRTTCSKRNDPCSKCIEEDKQKERQIKRDLQLEQERLARQQAYRNELQEIQDQIDSTRRRMKYEAEAEDQKKTLAQQKEDLKNLEDAASRAAKMKAAAERAATETSSSAAAETEKTSSGNSDKNAPGNISDSPTSSAQGQWEYMKQFEGARSKTLDELMGMIGLEEVKETFLNIKNTVDTKLRQNVSLASQRFSCSLLGNPGTGKTTVARLYAKFLTDIGVIPGSQFEETTGSKMASGGIQGCQKLIDGVLNNGGGVIFIDEAYQLTSGNSPGGAGVLDYLLPEVENLTGKIVFVLAGYNKQMESLFAHNPGLPSRFPIEMKFADYDDDELLRILNLKINKQYKGNMKCEDGLQGLFCRIVSRRIGRGRGREGFGNARTVENALAKITMTQAKRLARERRAKLHPDDFLLTKEDLIGPKPAEALGKSDGWQKLTKLIGLSSVKQAVRSLVDSVQQNYDRELNEQPPIEYSLNKVFLGNPGTGKTTVAKLYGQILVDLGLLSKGEVVVKNPSDFVGSALGQSEQQTKGILAASEGKVLVIDEAYGLYSGSQGSADIYKTAVIDTLVAEIQSVPGDDRCVLLLGYRDQMENMFQNVNPGLSRRFPLASAFEFTDFSNDELRQILELKLKQQGFGATEQAKTVALEMLDRARNRPNFGNGGEIDIILDASKARHQARLSGGKTTATSTLEALDFDENFDRAERNDTNVQVLFEGSVGAEGIVKLLSGYQDTVRAMKALDMDPKENIPFNFVFRGPPGTGKTTTARKMGKVFYDMGFLAAADVIECSATDLIGQYVGQTGPKVQKLLDKALGRVLFIDEAYRLADGGFAKDAIDELVDSVTKDKYHKKLIIILAGYEADINRLMSINEGLTSRFPEVVNFRGLKPKECFALLTKQLASQRETLESKGINLNLDVLESPAPKFTQNLTSLFHRLSQQKSWASARDVQTVGKEIFNDVLKSRDSPTAKTLTLTEKVVVAKLENLLKERELRSQQSAAAPKYTLDQMLTGFDQQNGSQNNINTSTKTNIDEAASDEEGDDSSSEGDQTNGDAQAQRDAGVSDEVWEQLERDKRAEQEREEEYQKLLKAQKDADDAERARIVKKLQEEERKKKEEAAARKKLETMGICPAGYQWIKQADGYRCAGGSHFRSNEALRAACK